MKGLAAITAKIAQSYNESLSQEPVNSHSEIIKAFNIQCKFDQNTICKIKQIISESDSRSMIQFKLRILFHDQLRIVLRSPSYIYFRRLLLHWVPASKTITLDCFVRLDYYERYDYYENAFVSAMIDIYSETPNEY